MCLIVIALGVAPRYPLIVAANRDEQHGRPTDAAAWWTNSPRVFGGRDLLAGGSWLAVDRRGRLAAVTNIRETERRPGPRSRGVLVTDYLGAAHSAASYSARVVEQGAEFGPFNLLIVERNALYYASNRAGIATFGPGLHAFSNAPLGTDWPKITTARAGVERLLSSPAPTEPLFELLAERSDAATPEQRYRASHFMVGPRYGTRCSTVVLGDVDGNLTFVERSFDADGRPGVEVRESFERESS
jgi:uncharacterized protein with NRDE domain